MRRVGPRLSCCPWTFRAPGAARAKAGGRHAHGADLAAARPAAPLAVAGRARAARRAVLRRGADRGGRGAARRDRLRPAVGAHAARHRHRAAEPARLRLGEGPGAAWRHRDEPVRRLLRGRGGRDSRRQPRLPARERGAVPDRRAPGDPRGPGGQPQPGGRGGGEPALHVRPSPAGRRHGRPCICPRLPRPPPASTRAEEGTPAGPRVTVRIVGVGGPRSFSTAQGTPAG